MTAVLFATSEVRPLIKTGGLGDVSAALPTALRKIGIDCRILMPGYTQVMDTFIDYREAARFHELPHFGTATLLEGRLPDSEVPLYVIHSPEHYLRDGGPYQDAAGRDYPDNPWGFALLARVAAILAGSGTPLEWRPDLLHCNDWQTGLAPAYLHFSRQPAPTVMTIHHLAYQGVFPADLVARLGLPPESYGAEGVEYYGSLSFLKAGLYFADRLTTVSPTYAREIQCAPLGMGMQGLLHSRRDHLSGILNGIDTANWNPEGDAYLNCRYSARALAGKQRCKEALQNETGLEVDPDAPLLGLVSRLANQKGLDWVLETSVSFLARGAQLVVLGTGEEKIERGLRKLARANPGRVAVHIGYDEALSHRIEAGIDMFLMPSRFEPCGLNQMYSLRYGSIPIVHATGGLKDTVREGVTGFVYHKPDAYNLWLAIERALARFEDKAAWRKMMLAGMKQDLSWEKSAREYAAVYAGLAA